MTKLKVLVVDDDSEILQCISTLLRSADYEVLIAMDTAQATGLVAKQSPDLIIIDLTMPAGGGRELINRIKMSTKTAFTPFMVISGSAKPEDIEWCKNKGAFEYMIKPFKNEQLLDCINNVMRPVARVQDIVPPLNVVNEQ